MPRNAEVGFDWVHLVESTGNDTKRMTFREGETIFAQGDDADSAFYIQHGSIKKIYVSGDGKERIVGILKSRDFFGVGCLIGRKDRRTTTVAMTDCSVIRIDRGIMLQLLCDRPGLADLFIAFLVDQSDRLEKDLLGHLFHSSERRLVRTLLVLADLGESDGRRTTLPRISQENLANIVGTTRSRINHFIKKFRQQGVIEYDGRIRVSMSRLHGLLDKETEARSKD
jgi:CRP-like cAMP-binding protein